MDEPLRRLKESGLKAFTVWDACDLLGPNKNTARKRLRRYVKKGLVFRSPRRFQVYRGQNTAWLYSTSTDPARRTEDYADYLLACLKRDAPHAAKCLEVMEKGGVYPATEFYRRHKWEKGADILFALVDLGILRVLVKDGRKYLCSSRIEDVALRPRPERLASFSSVAEMIRAGFCRTRAGKVLKIPAGVRVGMPEDDIILSTQEVSRLIEAVEPGNMRDRLFLGLLFRTGARISQNINLRVEDFDLGAGRVFIRSAKEGISFYRYLDPGFLQELSQYIRAYSLRARDLIFFPGNTSKPLGRRTAADILNRYAILAGIQYQYVDVKTGELRNRVHPHTAKYTFCSWAYGKQPDMLLVALTVGNKTIYPMMKSYIKVPTCKRHALAGQVMQELTTPQIEIKDIIRPEARL